MTVANPTSKLVGRAGVAEILGVSRQRVDVIEHQRGFPKPFGHDENARPIWQRKVIDRYAGKRLEQQAERVREVASR